MRPASAAGHPTRDQGPNGQLVWRAWTCAGDPVEVAGVGGWRRRGDAAAALAWVTPASRARFMALAAHVRGLADRELHELLRGLPCAVFDRLLETAYAGGDGGMIAVKRCPRCGQVKRRPASSTAAQDPARGRPAPERWTEGRQRRHRHLGGQGPSGGDAV